MSAGHKEISVKQQLISLSIKIEAAFIRGKKKEN